MTTYRASDFNHNGLTVDIDIEFYQGVEVEILDVRLNSITIPTAVAPDLVLERLDLTARCIAKLEGAIHRDIELDDDYCDALPALATPDDDDTREERAA